MRCGSPDTLWHRRQRIMGEKRSFCHAQSRLERPVRVKMRVAPGPASRVGCDTRKAQCAVLGYPAFFWHRRHWARIMAPTPRSALPSGRLLLPCAPSGQWPLSGPSQGQRLCSLCQPAARCRPADALAAVGFLRDAHCLAPVPCALAVSSREQAGAPPAEDIHGNQAFSGGVPPEPQR
jgi:hypothetical protein